MIYFCGYPIVNDVPGGAVYKPCGKHATPGCAFCDEHAQRPLTEQDIVDRAADRWRWYWREWWCFPIAILLLWVLALYPPSWTIFLRAHVEFLWGVLAGSLLQVPGWLRDRWRWMKLFSWS
jgi:hypothetical protein